MPTVTSGSIPHAAQTPLKGRSDNGLDSLVVNVSVSVGVQGGVPGTRIVFSTRAASAAIVRPLWDPESGQSLSKTSVTPSPIRYDPVSSSTLPLLPPNR